MRTLTSLVLLAVISSGISLAQTAIRFDSNDAGRDGLLGLILHEIEKNKDLYIGPILQDEIILENDANLCSEDKLAKYDIKESWDKCAGIPDLFFKDGSGTNAKPRQVKLRINNLKAETLRVSNLTGSCKGDICMIDLQISVIVLKFDWALIQSYPSKRVQKYNQPIFALKGTKLELNSTKSRHEPIKLTLKAIINSDKTGALVRLDPTHTRLNLPMGSLFLRLSKTYDELSLKDFLNHEDTPFQFGTALNMAYNTMMFLLSSCSSIAKEVKDYIDFSIPLNHHLARSDKVGTLNKWFSSWIFPLVFSKLNEGIAKSQIFSGQKFSLPAFRMQDVLDYPVIHAQIISFISFLRDHNIEGKQEYGLSLDSFSYQGQTWPQLLSSYASCRDESILQDLKKAQNELKIFCGSVNARRCSEYQRDLDRFIKNNNGHLEQLQLALSLRFDRERFAGKTSTWALNFAETPEGLARTRLSEPQDGDLALTLNPDILTEMSTRRLKAQPDAFTVCLSPKPGFICAQLPVGKTTKLKMLKAPYFVYSEEQMRYSALMEFFSEADEKVLTLDFGLRTRISTTSADKARILFSLHSNVQAGLDQSWKKQFIDTLTLALITRNPLLIGFLPNKVDVTKLESEGLDYSLKLKRMSWQVFDIVSQGMHAVAMRN